MKTVLAKENLAGDYVSRTPAFAVIEYCMVSQKYCDPRDDDMVHTKVLRTLCYTTSAQEAWDLVEKLRDPIKEETGNDVCVQNPDGVLL